MGPLFCAMRFDRSHEVVEVFFRPHPAPDAENVRWGRPGVHLDVVSGACSQIARSAEEVMDLVWLPEVQSPFGQGQVHPTRMFVVGIQVDNR